MSEVLTLQRDATTLDLTQWQANGIAIAQKDFGTPEIREVTYANPSSDGVDDQTRFVGQRVVQLTGKCFSQPGKSRSAAYALLHPFLDPAARCTLQYSLDSDTPVLQLNNLRVSQFSRVTSSPNGFDISLQWKADPAALSLVQSSLSMQPSGLSALGRAYPLVFPRVYPTTPGGSAVNAVSRGTYKTWPLLRIYGPCTGPVVIWTPPGATEPPGELALTGYTIPSGNYVEVDTNARTALLGGPGGTDVYSSIDFSNTVWSPIYPGSNAIQFIASAAAVPCLLTMLWNDAYL